MAYNLQLAARVREYLAQLPDLEIEEKKMFRGLAFMVNGKMCVNVSGEYLMCRFDPALGGDLTERSGYLPVVMRGKEYKGYCYVDPEGVKSETDFAFWLGLCLEFNGKAKSTKKKKFN